MVPVEVFMGMLWLTFVFVGLSREFPRELGATIGIVGMMLLLDLAGERMSALLVRGLSAAGIKPPAELVTWTLYSFIIGLTVFFVYEGEGMVYAGLSPPGPLGNALDVAIGLFNGWLVVGTWWFYTHALGYPMQQWGLYTGPISERGARFVELTPMAILPDAFSYLYLVGILLFLIILKVAR
jgi:hypothetical protein